MPESTISGRMALQTAVRARTSRATRIMLLLLVLLLLLLHSDEGVAVMLRNTNSVTAADASPSL